MPSGDRILGTEKPSLQSQPNSQTLMAIGKSNLLSIIITDQHQFLYSIAVLKVLPKMPRFMEASDE